MKITGLLLIMVMMTNILDNIQEAQRPQNHKENIEDTNIQRKLEESTNYITLKFNQDCSFTIANKSIIKEVRKNSASTAENIQNEI